MATMMATMMDKTRIRSGQRAVSMMVLVGLVLSDAAPAFAYLRFGVPVAGRTVAVKWAHSPVRYRVFEEGTSGVSALQFRDAMASAFATWEAVPTATIRYVFDGFTSTSRPGDEDSVSTLGFDERPDLDRVLASTTLLIDEETGALLESDIFFNTSFSWSIAPNGEPGRFDLASIAVHEIGHFSGLGHSAIGETELINTGRRVLGAEAVMFPIAFGPGTTTGRVLRPDDIAGVSDLYPESGFERDTGSLSGQVTRDGFPVYGAHVVAFSPRTGTLVGNFTLNTRGQFSIGGLAPGAYIVRVEPLDDADVTSFLDDELSVDVDFRATVHDRVVVVPRAGDSGNTVIEVSSK